MATIEQYSWGQLPYVLMGTPGTSGDLIYLSTGTGLTVKSHAAGTAQAAAFAGILENTTGTGQYGAVTYGKVVQLPNFASDVVELGAMVYIGTSAVNDVGTLDTGTAIGVCAKRAAAADAYVSVLPIPFWEARANG